MAATREAADVAVLRAFGHQKKHDKKGRLDCQIKVKQHEYNYEHILLTCSFHSASFFLRSISAKPLPHHQAYP